MTVKYSRCNAAALSTVPVVDGQFVYTKDTHEQYLDTGSVRNQITGVIVVADVTARNAITISNKPVFVVSLKEFHVYNGTAWNSIVADSIANRVAYNNSASELTATTVQSAIDELADSISTIDEDKMDKVPGAIENRIAIYDDAGQVKEGAKTLADITSDIASAISTHNTGEATHSDIRLLVSNLEYVASIEYNSATGDLTFIYQDESDLTVNIKMPEMAITFDVETDELVINEGTDDEVRVPLGDMIPVFEGSTGDEIQIKIESVEGNQQIQAVLLNGKVVEAHLSTALAAKINGKLDKDQGSANAGKVMTVGIDGIVVPAAPAETGVLDVEVDLGDGEGSESVVDGSGIAKIDVSGKLDKDQGSANAAKYMKVGAGGILTPANITAAEASYVNTTSNLVATNAQAAIDEVVTVLTWNEY